MQKKNKIEEIKQKYENVFNTPDGKKVLEDIISSGGIFRCSGDVSEIVLARDDGKRELALHIKFMSEPQPEYKKVDAITS